MSWGNKLLIAFIAFAALICTLVYKAVNTPTDLVSEQYYDDELKYEDRIQAINNAAGISDVQVQQDASTITVTLPREMDGRALKGQAYFYCKTRASKDKYLSLATNTRTTVFPRKELPKGSFVLKLSWKSGKENFYTERSIIL
jgi:hypothetical protein